jgi:hypothetical protein
VSATAGSIVLPRADGSLAAYDVGKSRAFPPPEAPLGSRVFFAAAHVVADPLHEPDGSGRACVDWDATLAYREHLWTYGLGVAEAMDTAQRGSGLDWPAALELIRRTASAAAGTNRLLVCGAGTDHLRPGRTSIPAVIDAYIEQCAAVEDAGARTVMMASRVLCASATGPDDYHRVYEAVLTQLRAPTILHWLGNMFDPQLAGYWGHVDLELASEVLLSIVSDHSDRIDGIKVSLLDSGLERELRSRLPEHVRLYTGDDYNYPELIVGDGVYWSDALLGVFDPIAPVAAAALGALDSGDPDGCASLLRSTQDFARQLFAPPTQHYKTGVVFIAYLNGFQSHFRMVGGAEGTRSILHLSELFRLADRAGLLLDPERAATRLQAVLRLAGVGA